jgi:hypothetical protein
MISCVFPIATDDVIKFTNWRQDSTCLLAAALCPWGPYLVHGQGECPSFQVPSSRLLSGASARRWLPDVILRALFESLERYYRMHGIPRVAGECEWGYTIYLKVPLASLPKFGAYVLAESSHPILWSIVSCVNCVCGEAVYFAYRVLFGRKKVVGIRAKS